MPSQPIETWMKPLFLLGILPLHLESEQNPVGHLQNSIIEHFGPFNLSVFLMLYSSLRIKNF